MVEDDLGNECTTKGEIFHVEGVLKYTTYTRKSSEMDERCELCCQQPETCAHLLWECPFARNVWALVRGRVQKVQQWGLGLFPSISDVREETDKRRDGEMGDSVVGNLECKKQAILWENSDTPQGNHGGGASDIRELSNVVCYSRGGLTHKFGLNRTNLCL